MKNSETHFSVHTAEPLSASKSGVFQKDASFGSNTPGNDRSSITLADSRDCTSGIDTIRIAVPVLYDDCYFDPSTSNSRRERRNNIHADVHRTTIEVGDANISIQLNSAYQSATLEFNAARVLCLPVPRLLPPHHIHAVVRHVIDQASHLITPTFRQVDGNGEMTWESDWATQVKVLRLDLARDFHVETADREVIKAGLPTVARAGRARMATYTKGRHGWTLSRQTSKSGNDNFYDKTAQDPNVEGQVFRFETQLRGDRLKSKGLGRLSDVTPERAEYALGTYWNDRHFGDPWPVSISRADQFAHVPKEDYPRLNSYLHDAAAGDLSLYGVREAKRLKAEARGYGFNPGRSLLDQSPMQAYLDLNTGTLVRGYRTPPLNATSTAPS